jgi:hypothetical protein
MKTKLYRNPTPVPSLSHIRTPLTQSCHFAQSKNHDMKMKGELKFSSTNSSLVNCMEVTGQLNAKFVQGTGRGPHYPDAAHSTSSSSFVIRGWYNKADGRCATRPQSHHIPQPKKRPHTSIPPVLWRNSNKIFTNSDGVQISTRRLHTYKAKTKVGVKK